MCISPSLHCLFFHLRGTCITMSAKTIKGFQILLVSSTLHILFSRVNNIFNIPIISLRLQSCPWRTPGLPLLIYCLVYSNPSICISCVPLSLLTLSPNYKLLPPVCCPDYLAPPSPLSFYNAGKCWWRVIQQWGECKESLRTGHWEYRGSAPHRKRQTDRTT